MYNNNHLYIRSIDLLNRFRNLFSYKKATVFVSVIRLSYITKNMITALSDRHADGAANKSELSTIQAMNTFVFTKHTLQVEDINILCIQVSLISESIKPRHDNSFIARSHKRQLPCVSLWKIYANSERRNRSNMSVD